MLPNPRRPILQVLLLLSIMASFLLCFPSSGTAHAKKPSQPRDEAAWSRVAQCESGGWRVLGSAYPDSLGITRVNWVDAGGRPQAVGPVSQAGRAYQISIANRFIAAYHASIPDQNGCAAW